MSQNIDYSQDTLTTQEGHVVRRTPERVDAHHVHTVSLNILEAMSRDWLYERPAPTTYEEYLRVVKVASNSIRASIRALTADFGGLYVAFVGHRVEWSDEMLEFFWSHGLEAPRDWSLHS